MATLTVTSISRDGIVPAPAAVASGGDEFSNDGAVFIEVHNDHATDPRTVTIVTQATVDSQAVSDRAVIITAANDRKLIGPFQTAYYNDGDGMVQLTYSDSGADMRIACFKLVAA